MIPLKDSLYLSFFPECRWIRFVIFGNSSHTCSFNITDRFVIFNCNNNEAGNYTIIECDKEVWLDIFIVASNSSNNVTLTLVLKDNKVAYADYTINSGLSHPLHINVSNSTGTRLALNCPHKYCLLSPSQLDRVGDAEKGIRSFYVRAEDNTTMVIIHLKNNKVNFSVHHLSSWQRVDTVSFASDFRVWIDGQEKVMLNEGSLGTELGIQKVRVEGRGELNFCNPSLEESPAEDKHVMWNTITTFGGWAVACVAVLLSVCLACCKRRPSKTNSRHISPDDSASLTLTNLPRYRPKTPENKDEDEPGSSRGSLSAHVYDIIEPSDSNLGSAFTRRNSLYNHHTSYNTGEEKTSYLGSAHSSANSIYNHLSNNTGEEKTSHLG
ncbi:uncharacterized protein LOC121874175 isoform X2 [Homarus americanus]|nr:uncharacterized protein LOC121874175 isoform X2 [Homarus americanus]